MFILPGVYVYGLVKTLKFQTNYKHMHLMYIDIR